MKKFLTLSAPIALLSCAAALPALAETGDWYVHAHGGLSALGDDNTSQFTEAASASTQSLDASFSAGWGSGLSVGRWFGDQLRADLDWTYRSNDIDVLRLADGRAVDDGNYASTTLSANVYYHLQPPAETSRLGFYVGAGLAYVTEIDIDLEGDGLGTGMALEDLEDDGVGFALMGGVTWRQSERLLWTAQVDWLSFGEATLEDTLGNAVTEIDYAPVRLSLGLNYRFGQ